VTLALVGVFLVFPAIERKRYRDRLEQEEHKLEPTVSRVVSLEQETRNDQTKALLLNEVRRRPQADLDVLNELTRLLPPPIWTSSIEIYPDSVVITGEADQAAPLLKILDASSQFQNSEFALPLTRGDQIEQFRIKTTRRGRAGRSTP
jgi:Tfp pilus assembly protein PilN